MSKNTQIDHAVLIHNETSEIRILFQTHYIVLCDLKGVIMKTFPYLKGTFTSLEHAIEVHAKNNWTII